MFRTFPAAAASLAKIFARSRLGMAMAARIRTNGMAATPRYPITRPAMARPRPFRRPALFLISDREIWPRMIATMQSGNTLMMPRIRLATALPLVSSARAGAGPSAAGPGADRAGAEGATGETGAGASTAGLPQFAQKRLLSARAAPHFEQVTICASCKLPKQYSAE